MENDNEYDREKPLTGIKVLDFTRVLAGPYATMMLGDMGAEIIKVEPPAGDDSRYFGPPFINDESTYFLAINRNKKSIVIDLKKKEGKDIVKELVKQVDVLVENYRPGVMEKLGLTYEILRKINPKLIYTSCSGYGNWGPYKFKPGYDMIIQAEAGLMSVTSFEENGPYTRVGVSVADIFAAMNTAFGIVVKLFHRERDNRSDKIDVAMLDSQVALLTHAFTNYKNFRTVSKPVGNRHPFVSPFASFRTEDSEIVITAGNNKLFANLCKALRIERLITDKRFDTNAKRVENNEELKVIIEKETRTYTLNELLKILEKAGVPAAPINTIKEAGEDSHLDVRNMFQIVRHPKTGKMILPGIPVKFRSCNDNIIEPPPRLGEHTKDILKKYLNYNEDEIDNLFKNEVVK